MSVRWQEDDYSDLEVFERHHIDAYGVSPDEVVTALAPYVGDENYYVEIESEDGEAYDLYVCGYKPASPAHLQRLLEHKKKEEEYKKKHEEDQIQRLKELRPELFK